MNVLPLPLMTNNVHLHAQGCVPIKPFLLCQKNEHAHCKGEAVVIQSKQKGEKLIIQGSVSCKQRVIEYCENVYLQVDNKYG